MADPEYVARAARIRQEREREWEEEKQRREEKHQQNELRRAQMTPEERAADVEDEERRKANGRRLAAMKGHDHFEMALNGQFLGPDLQGAVLGQTPFAPDQTAFLRSLDGYKEEMGDIKKFQGAVSGFHDLDLYWASPELCKFALCDWRVPRYRKDYNSAGLNDIYKRHLRRVRKNDRVEQARALARPSNLKAAQYWARKMLDEFEAAAARGEKLDALQAWIGMRIRTPSWVNEIAESKEDYGFIIYKSREAVSRPTIAQERWFQVWNGRKADPNVDIDLLSDDFPSYRNAEDKVYHGWLLHRHMLPLWVSPCLEHGLPSEQTPSAFREHFKTVETPKISNPRILKNTFLVLADDCIFHELDTHELNYDFITGPQKNKVLPEQVPNFFLWAYDPDWEPPSPPDTVSNDGISIEGCTCRGTFTRGYGGADEDGYEGRVKVSISDLFCWFYYARVNGVGLKDLWRKAQGMEDQTWWSRGAYWDPSQPEWLA
ncbi:hypothetical protein AK830_g6992 [Neonectria ditissima]|uniref:Uncharacterized protein n=1 Tax=Neonectria ditissima TaxID=78410 RepID=A0A0N8H6P7_9HYPO|nr:hypothetical protein AK830_g6992 [Neonectria ditissima]